MNTSNQIKKSSENIFIDWASLVATSQSLKNANKIEDNKSKTRKCYLLLALLVAELLLTVIFQVIEAL